MKQVVEEDLKKIMCDDVDGTHVAQDRDYHLDSCTLINVVLHKRRRVLKFLSIPSASQERSCFYS